MKVKQYNKKFYSGYQLTEDVVNELISLGKISIKNGKYFLSLENKFTLLDEPYSSIKLPFEMGDYAVETKATYEKNKKIIDVEIYSPDEFEHLFEEVL